MFFGFSHVVEVSTLRTGPSAIQPVEQAVYLPRGDQLVEVNVEAEELEQSH